MNIVFLLVKLVVLNSLDQSCFIYLIIFFPKHHIFKNIQRRLYSSDYTKKTSYFNVLSPCNTITHIRVKMIVGVISNVTVSVGEIRKNKKSS